MLNMSSLFYNGTDDECLLNNLELSTHKKQILNDAKNLVRQTLRNNLPKVLAKIAGEDAVAQPRFFTQGSWAYKTINSPAQHPQQADLDDGTYLPLSFVSEIRKPSYASKIYFDAVESVLAPLANERGWRLITDKPTCTRLEISVDSHIDIPLYAIPDNEYATLTEARADSVITKVACDAAKPDVWAALPSDEVLLAHRDENWKVSDPRVIKDWFTQQVKGKGEQLRRIVRYLKAFRDKQWPTGGPSSILLMTAAEPLFQKHDGRDDLALLNVLQKLPERLRNGVNNPTDHSECLTDRLSRKEIEHAALKYEELSKDLADCLHNSDRDQACTRMRETFGPRFPNAPGRIVIVQEDMSHVEVPPWGILHAGSIEILATQHDLKDGLPKGGYHSNGTPLIPGTWIHFSAQHTFSPSISIKWQVVNTGIVAKIARQLRGKINQTGQDIWEHTAYRGKHWVECFAVDTKRGVCLGRSGRFYVNVA